MKYIGGLDAKKSCGIDGVSAKEIKCIADKISPILAHIFTLSIKSGVFPKALKSGIVVPIHKAGSKKELNNYRPISLLSVLSKMHEKITKRKLVEFLDRTGFFSSRQYGFRQGLSTERALENHIEADNIVEGLNAGKKLEPCTLTKAFDMVEYDLLLNKMVNSGVRDVILKWFKSYLSGRNQWGAHKSQWGAEFKRGNWRGLAARHNFISNPVLDVH